MLRQKTPSIYSSLSSEYNLPVNVIEVICNSPFKFAKQIIESGDTKDVMLAYLFKIKLKKRYKNESAQV